MEVGIKMAKKETLIEFYKKGSDFGFNIPKGTSVANIEQAIALFIIDNAKYRTAITGNTVKPATVLAEISQWATQLEENL